jgi:hypothetical protein
MSHVQLLLNMVSVHKDDLELWSVDVIKTGTLSRITKLASDAYIQEHNNQQEAEKQKTTHEGTQTPLVRCVPAPPQDGRTVRPTSPDPPTDG